MDCLFCKIVNKEISCEKLYEDDKYIAFSDINPQAPHHYLIIPKKHISMIDKMQDGDAEIIGGLFLVAKKIAKKLDIVDYRLVINNGENVGQTVFHVHLHMLAGRSMTWPPG